MTTQEILEAARGAKTAVALSDSGTRDSALLGMADALCAPESMDAILAANADQKRMAQLEEENQILKKAIAIFTPHSSND